MDFVLGLSLTSAAVRWVLVEGTTGEGDPVDRGELDIPAIDAVDADLLIEAVLNPAVIADGRIRVVGVTCTAEASSAGGAVVDTLKARGLDVAAVSESAAAAALASGITGITGYDHVAICIVEPDSAVVAQVAGGEVAVEQIFRPLDGVDALELTSRVIAVLDPDDRPDAIFVIGSDDVDMIVSSFEAITTAPVFSAAEADLALARGAALAGARTLDMSDPQDAERSPAWASRTGVLSTVLAAAVVTFVVSLSMALGLSWSQDPAVDPPQSAGATERSEPTAVQQAVPALPAVRFPDASPVLARTMVIAAPAAPAPVVVPIYEPPPAAAPVVPPPVYQPPAPVYVPPVPQQPRLRDRILERIPIINRFHDP